MKFRRILVIPGVILCAGLVSAQPKIDVVDGATIDMGSVYAGEVVQKVAVIRNLGTDTLKITEVKAQCGCTATLLSEKILAPNDTGRLSISFNTAGRSGHQGKQVYVMSNDPQNPKFTINFSAEVMSILDINPKVVTFQKSRIDSSYTQTIMISNPSQTDAISILSVKADLPTITTSLMKNKLMPGEQTQLQVTVTPTKSGTMNGKVEMMIDHKRQQKFDIGVFAFVSKK
jgi:hypothetical protein